MAQAKKIQKRVPHYVKEDRFVLTLTEGEADFLLGVLSRVGGVKHSPRKYGDRVIKVLQAALGYGFLETDAFKLSDGQITMHPYSLLKTQRRQEEALAELRDKLSAGRSPYPSHPGIPPRPVLDHDL